MERIAAVGDTALSGWRWKGKARTSSKRNEEGEKGTETKGAPALEKMALGRFFFRTSSRDMGNILYIVISSMFNRRSNTKQAQTELDTRRVAKNSYTYVHREYLV
jgi:hypothetical protein